MRTGRKMQCFEFEAVVQIAVDLIADLEPNAGLDRHDVADVLSAHRVATVAGLRALNAAEFADLFNVGMSAIPKAA